MQSVVLLFSLLAGATSSVQGPVVLTGATGRTGIILYRLLKQHNIEVRPVIHDVIKAKMLYNCSKCDPSEGVWPGDIKDPDSLKDVMAGASILMIATGAHPSQGPNGTMIFPEGAGPKEIDWDGARNQLKAFATRKGASDKGHIVLISAMNTIIPEDPTKPFFEHYDGFYKLNFEAELMSSGVPFTIVKPCGLDYGGSEPGVQTMLVGHDSEIKVDIPSVARADLARLMVASIEQPEISKGLRFDLCAKPGTPTTDADLGKLLQSAAYPWNIKPAAVTI